MLIAQKFRLHIDQFEPYLWVRVTKQRRNINIPMLCGTRAYANDNLYHQFIKFEHIMAELTGEFTWVMEVSQLRKILAK